MFFLKSSCSSRPILLVYFTAPANLFAGEDPAGHDSTPESKTRIEKSRTWSLLSSYVCFHPWSKKTTIARITNNLKYSILHQSDRERRGWPLSPYSLILILLLRETNHSQWAYRRIPPNRILSLLGNRRNISNLLRNGRKFISLQIFSRLLSVMTLKMLQKITTRFAIKRKTRYTPLLLARSSVVPLSGMEEFLTRQSYR
jgi:hypothetical protein